MKKALIPILFAFLPFLTGCPGKVSTPQPKPDTLPPITQTGANTLGCLINGKAWLPTYGSSYPVTMEHNMGLFSLGTHRQIYNVANQLIVNNGFGWSIYPVRDTGLYFVKNGYSAIGAGTILEAGFIDDLQKKSYVSNDADSLKNWIHVTRWDTVKFVASGNFNFFFTSPDHSDTIKITNGRFDYKFN